MPQFIINEKNAVLVDLPQGKSYITEPEVKKEIVGQKGDTCWYSILSFLRPRYGKKIDALDAVAHKNIEYLKTERDYEKKLSHYRKSITQQTLIYFYAALYLEHCQANVLALNKVNIEIRLNEIQAQKNDFGLYSIRYLMTEKIKAYEKNLAKTYYYLYSTLLTMDEDWLEKEVLTQFMKQNKHDEITKSYLEDHYIHRLLDTSHEALKKITTKSYSFFQEEKITTKTLYQQETYLRSLILQDIREHYALPISTWHPKKSIDDLIESLRQSGAHAIGGMLGLPFYQSVKQIDDKKGYKIYEQNNNVKAGAIPHILLIVGAEKAKDSKDKDAVYLYDSNMHLNTLLKISYEHLCSNICDISGQIYDKDNASTYPYAICANETEIKKSIEIYREVKNGK